PFPTRRSSDLTHRGGECRQPRADPERDTHEATNRNASYINDLAPIQHRHRARLAHSLRQLFQRLMRQFSQVQRRKIAVAQFEYPRCQKKVPALRGYIAEVLEG